MLFSSRKMKKVEREKFVCNLNDKKYCFLYQKLKTSSKIYTRTRTKIHRVIKFNKKDWTKPYIDTYTELQKNGKLINNSVFGKTIEDAQNIEK